MARFAYHLQQIKRLEHLMAELHRMPDVENETFREMLESIDYTVHFLTGDIVMNSCAWIIQAHDCWHIQDRWEGRARTTSAEVFVGHQYEPREMRWFWEVLLLRLMREHRKGIRRSEPFIGERYPHLVIIALNGQPQPWTGVTP